MTLKTRIGLLALTALLAQACGGPKEEGPPPGGATGLPERCLDDSECLDENFYFCNTATNKCEATCRVKTDCSKEVRTAANPAFELDFCNGDLGCECDIDPSTGGRCVAALCSADADCGATSACRNGACVAFPTAASSCSISPDLAVVKVGETVKFHVSSWDSANKPVVLQNGGTWTATGGFGTVPASAAGHAVEFTASTATTGQQNVISASVGGATCTAKAIVLSNTAIAAGTIRAVVTDELSGRPVAAAQILTCDADGANCNQSETNADGVATGTITGTPTNISVTAFHADFTYVTIANYPTSGTRDLSFVVRRNQVDKYGGFKGTFTSIPANANVHAGIAGLSVAGSVTDLSIDQLLGSTVETDINVAGQQLNDVPLPAGVYLGLGDPAQGSAPFKGNISATGLAGQCRVLPGVETGSCGTRTAWALTTDVPVSDLPISQFAGGLSSVVPSDILEIVIPLLKTFNSSVVRDVEYSLQATPGVDGGNQDLSNTAHFTTQNLDLVPNEDDPNASSALPLRFSYAVDVPALPSFRGAPVEGAVVLAGANVPGRGVVPLGLGAGINTAPVDDRTDTQQDLPAAGLVLVRQAPTHHGLEGNDYLLVTIAASTKLATDATAGLATSGLISRITDNKLRFDQKGASPFKLGGAGSAVPETPATFLGFPEGAAFNFHTAAQTLKGILLQPRQLKSSANLSGANVVKVSFSTRSDRRWVVYLDGAQLTTGFRLPAPPAGFEDRLFHDGSSGSRSPFQVQGYRLHRTGGRTGNTFLTFRDLMEFNSTNADRLIDFTTGFTVLDYNRPQIEWKTPAAANTEVTRNTQVVTKVKFFRIAPPSASPAGDGKVRITWNKVGGGQCTPATTESDVDPSSGKGEIAVTVPDCGSPTAIDVDAVAQLTDAGGTPIQPAVSSTLRLKVKQ